MRSELDAYFRAQQVSPQWAMPLQALGDAMAESSGERELAGLFRAAGARMAEQLADDLVDADTLEDLAKVLNAHWLRCRWGWVEFDERKKFIEITHHAAPLGEAFGAGSLAWSSGFLEGFYEALLHNLGADDGLVVRLKAVTDDGLRLLFTFGR